MVVIILFKSIKELPEAPPRRGQFLFYMIPSRLTFNENEVRLVIHKPKDGIVWIEVYYPENEHSELKDSEDFYINETLLKSLLNG